MVVGVVRTDDFVKARSDFVRYETQSNPEFDPLARKQLESVRMHWEEYTPIHVNVDDMVTDTDTDIATDSTSMKTATATGPDPTLDRVALALEQEVTTTTPTATATTTDTSWRKHQFHGRLVLSNDYLNLVILSRFDCSDDDRRVHFRLDARAELIREDTTEITSHVTIDSNNKKNNNKHQQENRDSAQSRSRPSSKMKREMAKRLASDPHLKPLLHVHNHGMSKSKNKSSPSSSSYSPSTMLLCEAFIHRSPDPTITVGQDVSSMPSSFFVGEEWYNVSDETLACIRAALFSHVDCKLTVLEFLLRCPWLPRMTVTATATAANNSDADSDGFFSPSVRRLGDRIALRLLEDALVDACDDEGEDGHDHAHVGHAHGNKDGGMENGGRDKSYRKKAKH